MQLNPHKACILLVSVLLSWPPFLSAQNESSVKELINPYDFPILLSGSFGELRANHFHSGIDFKTQGAEGKPTRAVAEGYISRISVSPGGYGNALYVTHPNGTTTVYGHLQRFSAPIAAYVKEQQYERESFSVNLRPDSTLFPVKKGEVIALSGNTGSSAGPHLHFEVRNTSTEEPIDPLEFYKSQIKDTKPPRIDGVMLYPGEGEGVVNGSMRKQEFKPTAASGNATRTLAGKIEAWGKIGLAVKAYDYMDNTSNIYGVKEITLTVDNQPLFHSYIDRLDLGETRYLNSFIDYEEWADKRSFYMKSFIEPGNRLPFLEADNNGYLTINEERTYNLLYTLTDNYGNSTRLALRIEGKQRDIPIPNDKGIEKFYRIGPNRFGAKGVRLTIPHGNLYDDFNFRYSVKEDSTALAATHHLHNKPMAMHRQAELSIRLQRDTLTNKKQYGIVRINKGRTSWIGGTWRNGWIDGKIRELGSYSLAQDVVPPKITPIDQPTWIKNRKISFRLTDNLSGVLLYRGEIDGEYVLFEMDNKSVITYKFDSERLSKGAHRLKLTVQDGCGNESVFEHSFTW